MRLLIDNLDGAGAVNYSAVMAAEGPLRIERTLNMPSTCRVSLDLTAVPTLKAPVRRGRMVVTRDDGTVMFTGYLPGEPEARCVGAGSSGETGLLLLTAESDDWLLDQHESAPGGSGFGLTGDALLGMLTSRTDPTRFETRSVGVIRSLGLFAPDVSRPWSVNAASVANGSYAAYRVVGGVVELQPGGAVTHTLVRTDGSLSPTMLELRSPRALVNDVTLSGEREPAAYVTEIFSGDGTTTEFLLSGRPFQPVGRGAKLPLNETFQGAGFDAAVWQVTDPGSHFSFSGSGAGLTLSGGTGLDGQTTLMALNAVEMGGSLVLEAGGVVLEAGSDGVLCGVYSGSVSRANCVAGFNVGQSSGATTVTPLVNGAATGVTATLASGHQYVLRLRLHAVEMVRVEQTFYTMVDGQVHGFGGGLVPAAVDAVFEFADMGLSSNTPATVLFDGTLGVTAASCSFAAINSVQLTGSIATARITRNGPLWVTSTSSSGTTWTRLQGSPGTGTDCEVTSEGRLLFYAGRVPASGETVRVMYRSSQRAVARLESAASVEAEGAANLPGVAAWAGQVLEPVARCSTDCANAAAALLLGSTSRTAAFEGTYVAENCEDIWPGDLLQLELTSGEPTVPVMVRQVVVDDQLSFPEVAVYRITFANDWAKELAIRTSPHLASDVPLPQPIGSAAGSLPANLQTMTVVSVSGTAIQVDAGVAPPTGGGFEVRRQDWTFGPGIAPDLVLRSPVRGFSIPRVAQTEQLYVRMYDGSAVAQYSAVSSAILTHVPVS